MNLPKSYDPSQYESSIYALWESSGAFKPKGKGKPYAIALPPPNANGNLHMGHALTVHLQDILIRYSRMKGHDAVYIPGADHAGFETWVVYEKELQKQGKSRFDFSREEIYSQVWDFVDKQRGNMELQLRALGASLDWDSLVFTLDKKVIDTAYGTFKKMWDDGLIYRGERIVNYCTTHQTSFADIEVIHKNEKTKIWQIAYPLLDRVGEIVVATTRPETLLGDCAVAVNPDDERYRDLIGMKALLPLVNREIPIIADDAIDPEFGTGAVKVTPAHDPTDFEIGERHQLSYVQVIDRSGRISNETARGYHGLSISEARTRILFDLTDLELMRGEVEYEHTVGHCYKCGTVIQPLLMEQWFVKVAPLAERAIAAVRAGELTFTPASKGDELIAYLSQLRDWNISRQPAWGIPIPAFQNIADHNDWIFDTRVDQPTIEVDGKTYRREEDTFDTWFSSCQWPYIVTDYLDKGELSKHYPLDVMETGHDILRPWVARMLMFGLYCTNQVPFKHVYMHGMVLDEHGQKMSKSKGNVLNPMEVVEAFGSDALRIGIVSARSAGQNQAFSSAKVVAGRNFCNKLWNIARYIEGRVGDPEKNHRPTPHTIADHWVVGKLDAAEKEIGRLISDYRFAEAADLVYHTVWDDVADWYIEASKLDTNKELLRWVLETCLKISHPFAPFVTETIWQTLKWEESPLIETSWPRAMKFDHAAAKQFDELQALVVETRYVASELGAAKQKLLYSDDKLIHDNADLLQLLAKLLTVSKSDKPQGLRLAVPGREAWLEIDEETLYEHQNKLEQRLAICRDNIKKLELRLNNKTYVSKAPERLVKESRAQLREQQELELRLQRELQVL